MGRPVFRITRSLILPAKIVDKSVKGAGYVPAHQPVMAWIYRVLTVQEKPQGAIMDHERINYNPGLCSAHKRKNCNQRSFFIFFNAFSRVS